MSLGRENMRGGIRHIYDLLLRAGEFAAQNRSSEEDDGQTLRIHSECGDLRIDCTRHNYPIEGRKMRIRIDDGTGLIVLDGEFCLTDVETPIVVSVYIMGDWELWIPVPGHNVRGE